MANNFDIKDFTSGLAQTIKSTDNAGVQTPHHNVDTLDTITNVVSVDDNGGSLTVDNAGTFAVQASQSGSWSVDASGTPVPVTDNSGSLTVDNAGTFAVQAAQSGTWTVQPGNTANSTPWKVDASSVAVPVTDNAGSLTVDNAGTFAVQATLAAGATNIAKAEDAASANADVGVPAMAIQKASPADTAGTDGDYAMLQMSGGRLWVDPSGVTLTVASHNVTNAGTFAVQAAQSGSWAVDASGTPVPITDNSGSLTVDNAGTFAVQASQSGTWTVQPGNTANTTPWLATVSQGGNSATVSAGGALKVDASSVAVPITDNAGSLTVDNSGTFAVQAATNADGTSGSAVPSKGLLVQGSDGTNARNLSTTTGGVLKVDVSATAGNSTAIKVDGSAVAQPVTDNAGSLTVDAPVATPVFVRLSDGAAAISALPITDNAGSVTVDAPVATPVFVRLSDGASAITALPITDNSGSLTVDAAGDVASGASDSGNPVKIGGKANTGIPATVSDGQRTNANFDEYGRLLISDRDTELGLVIGTTGLRDRLMAQRMTVLSDSLIDGIAGFWTQTTAGGGTITNSGGEGLLKTSTGTTGSSQLSSTNVAYYPGQVAWMNSAIRFGDTGTAGNTRRVGMFTVSGTTPQDGFYYELSGTTLNAVYVKAGSATAVASGSWSRNSVAPFALDTNYHSFEIRYTANSVWFYVDNVLRHSVSGTSSPLTGTLTLPITITNVKTSGATDITFAVRNIGNGRFGAGGGVVNETGLSAVEAMSVGGGTPHDSVDSGNPVKIGGVARSSEPTAVANADRVQAIFDLVGKLIVLPYANPENFVSGCVSSAMTGTTSTSLIAAPAAGLRNYITQVTVSNSHAAVGTDVILQDGSGGTTIYVIPAAAVYGGAVITFPTPLRQPTTATALYCANVTTGASTKVSASGYKGA